MIEGVAEHGASPDCRGRSDLPTASVVIPTFNRLDGLQRVVAALRSQGGAGAGRMEIVAVDDGSTDGTAVWLKSEHGKGGLVALSQRNSGPAAARNRGAATAKGEILLFLGDDTVPVDGWLLGHLEEHRLFGGGHRPLAVLGYTGFPADHDTPFGRFINEYGAQFGYSLIEDPLAVPFNFFYTSNVSLPRRVFQDLGGFREDFAAAAWEDIEFAYRAMQSGLCLHYLPRARTVHHHRIQPRTFCRRQRTSGRAGAVFAGLHPELEGFLGVDRARTVGRTSSIGQSLLQVVVAIGERMPGVVPPRAYQKYLDLAYLEGMAEGLHGREV